MRPVWPLAALAIALLATLAPAAAATPRTTVNDLEDEVMCPICGTLLELSESPQAQRERAYIERLVRAGRTKSEIKDALVGEYGREVLALPADSGFSLSAYAVPIVAFALAAVALAIAVGRWRRRSPPTPRDGDASPPEGEAAERLEADLSRYDL
jgi:cytochrome c-type biogenesis protein CcmH